jgi:hypothetical protein
MLCMCAHHRIPCRHIIAVRQFLLTMNPQLRESLCFDENSFTRGWHLFSKDKAAALRAEAYADFVPSASRAAAASGLTRAERERTMIVEARVAAQLCADTEDCTAFFRSQVKAALDRAAARTGSDSDAAAAASAPSRKRKAGSGATVPNPATSSKAGPPVSTRMPNTGAPSQKPKRR